MPSESVRVNIDDIGRDTPFRFPCGGETEFIKLNEEEVYAVAGPNVHLWRGRPPIRIIGPMEVDIRP